MDFFSIFKQANEVFCKLVRDDSNIDVKIMPTESNGVFMSVSVKEEGAGSFETYQQFTLLPTVMRGDKTLVVEKLKTYIRNLKDLPCELYRQYGDFLQTFFFSANAALLGVLHTTFESIIQKYRNEKSVDIQVKLKFVYPPKIVLYSPLVNASLVFNMCTKHILISGFADPELIDKGLFKGISPAVEIQQDLITEMATDKILLKYPSLCPYLLSLNEAFFGDESVDEVLDKVIQHLTLLDILDGLQDVIIEEDSLFLCFDPLLDEEEAGIILNQIKMSYPQAILSTGPSSTSSWWVIEIGQIPQPTYGANSQMIQTQADPMSVIAKNLDINRALKAAGE